jgi:hypothetical protein
MDNGGEYLALIRRGYGYGRFEQLLGKLRYPRRFIGSLKAYYKAPQI